MIGIKGIGQVTHAMSSDEERLLASIAVEPTDRLRHAVYADWLDENGRGDEARRQRAWVDAYEHLMPYVRGGTWDYDEKTWARIAAKPVPYAEMMGTIQYWLDGINGKNTYGFGFGSNFAQDELYDSGNRRKFWDAFETITGVRPSMLDKCEISEDDESYHCAC